MSHPAATTDPADTLALAAARAMCKRQSRPFYLASVFLPRSKRLAAFTVVAFCRMIDEAIGPANPPAESASLPSAAEGGCCSDDGPARRFAMLRDRLDEIYDGRLQLPEPQFRTEAQHVLHAVTGIARRYQIPKQYFLDLAEGCVVDRTIPRYATWATLEQYCYHTGGAIAMMLGAVLGMTSSDAGRVVPHLGNAIRLTFILRDLKKDFARGHIFLPLEDLARFRYSENDLAVGNVNENFVAMMKFQIDRARQLYQQGADGLCWLADDGSRLMAATIASLSSGILTAIERQGYDVFSSPAELSMARQLSRLPAAIRLARRRDGQPIPPIFR